MRAAWLGLGLAALLLAGCQQATCGPDTCSGCCTSAGECLEGNSRTACGLGARGCVRCRGGELCLGGACELEAEVDAGTPTDGGGGVATECLCATSCCGVDGRCSAGNLQDSCGLATFFCVACADGERCEGGVCVAQGCGGCMDPLGRCQVGTAVTACGGDGGVCLACASDEVCTAGRCAKAKCDVTNCRFGCCRPDKSCVTVPSAQACGVGAAACATCGGGQSCLGGTCQ